MEKVKLLVVFVVLVGVLILRINANTYLTPDSYGYLSKAEEIKSAWGYPPESGSNFDNIESSYWPLGYPVSIALVSSLTGITLAVASKVVNIIFIGLIFLLLQKWFASRAWFASLSFFSFVSLEIFSYTWSETPFIFFVLLLCFVLSDDLNSEIISSVLFLKIAFCLIGLFLFRYAGLLYFGFVFVLLIKQGLFVNKKRAIQYGLALALSTVIVVIYCYQNMVDSGYYFGGSETIKSNEGGWKIILLFIKGLINAGSIARNYFFNGQWDYLYLMVILFQLLLIFILIKNSKYIVRPFLQGWNVRILFSAAFFYLAGILILRSILSFDSFDYRTLAPFTIPVFIALFTTISNNEQALYFEKVYRWIVLFMMLSSVVNLPKQYLVEKVASFIN